MSSKYAPWAKHCPAPGGHMFYIGLYRGKHSKIFLHETIKPRALIFGIKHDLVDPYQVCSNYAPGDKIARSWGSHVLHRFI